MPTNLQVRNIKPLVIQVRNFVPNDKQVRNITPNLTNLNRPMNFTYTETRTINVGNPIGLLLSLTYPNTFSFTATRL